MKNMKKCNKVTWPLTGYPLLVLSLFWLFLMCGTVYFTLTDARTLYILHHLSFGDMLYIGWAAFISTMLSLFMHSCCCDDDSD